MYFYGTFGQGQYSGLLKDYYVEISAPNREKAQQLMILAFGNQFSNIYDGLPDENDERYFMDGCLGKLEQK